MSSSSESTASSTSSSSSSSSQEYICEVLGSKDQFLEVYFPLEEASGNRVDVINGIVLSESGSTIGNITGKEGDCVYMSTATSPSDSINNSSPGINPSSSFAFSMWSKLNGQAGSSFTSGKYGLENACAIEINNNAGSGKFEGRAYLKQSDNTDITTSYVDLTGGQFNHLVAIGEGGNLYFYLNGSHVATTTYDSTIASFQNFTIDSLTNNLTLSCNHFIDELAYWKDITFSSTTERHAFVDALYNQNTGAFWLEGPENWDICTEFQSSNSSESQGNFSSSSSSSSGGYSISSISSESSSSSSSEGLSILSESSSSSSDSSLSSSSSSSSEGLSSESSSSSSSSSGGGGYVSTNSFKSDGSNDYLETDASWTTWTSNKLTVSFFMKWVSSSESKPFVRASSGLRWIYCRPDSSSSIRLIVYRPSDTAIQTGGGWADSTWHHVVLRCNPGTGDAQILIDNSAEASSTTISGTLSHPNGKISMMYGDAYFDEFIVTEGYDDPEDFADYSGADPCPIEPTVSTLFWYKADDVTALTTIPDSSGNSNDGEFFNSTLGSAISTDVPC
jgi:hypothetical protein